MSKFLETIGKFNISGSPLIQDIEDGGKVLSSHRVMNMFMAGGADGIAALIAGTGTRINTMYLEFENGAPGSIAEPSYAAEDGRAYFTGLTTPKDYLRIPLTVDPTISTTDYAYNGNQAAFFGITSGIVGMNGLPYSETAGSVVYGGALVISPDVNDPSQDQIFARTYWVDRLFPKSDGRQIGVQWSVRIVAPITPSSSSSSSSSSNSSSSLSSSSDSSSSFSSSSSSNSSSSFSSSSNSSSSASA
jgi:hypothetical protein